MTLQVRLRRAAWLLVIVAVTVNIKVSAEPRRAIPTCDSICDDYADCDAVCEDNSNFIVCGDYDGGYYGSRCDGSPEFDCTYTCDEWTSPGTSCIYDGGSTNCGDFGVAAQCGNGTCSDAESCGSCSTDCGACVSQYTISGTDANAWAGVVDDADYYGYLGGSIHGASQVLNLAAAAGLVPSHSYEVAWADDGEPYGMSQWTGGPPPPSPPPSDVDDVEAEHGISDLECDTASGSPDAGGCVAEDELGSLSIGRTAHAKRPGMAWAIGWYDCGVRGGRLNFLGKVSTGLSWAVNGMWATSGYLASNPPVAAAVGAAAASLNQTLTNLNGVIYNIDHLQCFPGS